MSITDRILVAIGASALVLLAAGVATGAWLAHSYGTLEVTVRSHAPNGDDVSIKVPGVLARAAVAFMPAEVRRESMRELHAWLPAAKGVMAELSRCPDSSLIDVKSHDGTVRISKRGANLLAEVTSPTEDVRISIPLRAASAVLEGLGGLADAPADAGME